ncbi:MAG: hypothetical protein L3J51_07435 [Cocleimonas sp.]|nr:hypothetical protein [Cocleimonas sp.]
MNSFSFPFKSNNNNKTSPASMEEFFTALSMESDGFYPFGINEFWHGGVHITNQSSGALKQGDGIQCIADGEVVAYRINEKHIDTPAYEDPIKGTSINIPYSSSFTLVRHKLEYPAKSGNILPVFSLYMHLLPWSEYEKETKKNSPAYFGKVNYKVSQSAKDNTPFAKTTLGANARLDIDNKLVLSRIPRGSLLELEGEVKKGHRAKIKKVVSGTPVKNPDIPEFGYVYIPDLEKLPPSPTGDNAGKPIYKVKATTTDTETFATGIVGTRARIRKTGKSKNHVLNLIPKGAELILEDNAGTTGRAKIISIKTGNITKNPAFDSLGTVWVNDLDKVTKPASFDKIETESKNKDLPKEIRKGDLIGYMGNYCTPEKPKNRPMLHWEVFAGEELNVFITKARASNKNPKKSGNGKTVLKIPEGLKLYSLLPSTKTETLTKETAVKVLKKKGDYIKIETLGLVATTLRSTLTDWKDADKTYAIKEGGLTSINGVTLTGRLKLLKSYGKGSNTLRAVLASYNAGKKGWIKKQTLSKVSKHTMLYIKDATDFWNDYPVTLSENGLKTDHEACYKTSDILKKWTDDKGVEWYDIIFDQHMPWYMKGYIDSTKITHHAPEEFICFDVVDVPSEGDGSYHLDPDKYYKTLFEPKTMEASKNEEETPISVFNLKLKPFAKKVFQFLDDNHDGTITLAEIQYALSDPIKQKKLGQLVTKHESEWVKSMDRWKHIEKYIPDETRFDWDYEKEKIKKLAWWDDVVKGKVTGFPKKEAYYFHPAGFVGNFVGCSDCGEKYLKKIGCTRYKRTSSTYAYGPIYKGRKPLSTYSRWGDLISSGKVTSNEKTILIGMSENEGNLDSVQSYDNQIFTAGAMQKTISPTGQGELPIQMNKFKELYPEMFQKYFKCCGWDVRKVSNKYTAYYKNKTGKELKAIIRKGFTSSTYGKKIKSPATAAFIEAISSGEYQDLQVHDFIDRLNNIVLKITPKDYSYKISSYVNSNLGKATVLDHHINRPSDVKQYFGNALDNFFASHPTVSKNPADWGSNHSAYEKIIIDYYGINRSGTDMVKRYNKMKAKL